MQVCHLRAVNKLSFATLGMCLDNAYFAEIKKLLLKVLQIKVKVS